MKRILTIVLTVGIGLVWLMAGAVSNAQSGVSVSGTIADETGAVITGEKITLLNRTTGETHTTKSNESGFFSFDGVTPGEYVLKGIVEGFTPTEMAITVADKPLIVKIRMKIIISEDVTVSAKLSEPELAENNADAIDFNTNVLSKLPVMGQDLLPILSNFLSPAALGTDGPSVIVDGVEGGSLDLPPDAIKSVAINKNPYSAEYRRPGLARIEVTTRSGKKYYEGDAAFSMRNSPLSARNAFAAEKTDLNQRFVSANLTGPLRLIAKTTLFLSGSRLMEDKSAVVNALTPDGPLFENVPTSRRNTNLLARFDIKPNKLTKMAVNYRFSDRIQKNRGVGGLRLREQGMHAGAREHRFQFSDSFAFSPTFINAFRIDFRRQNAHLGMIQREPTIQVKGAFTGGPSQEATLEQDTTLQFQDVMGYSRGIHTLNFGGTAKIKSLKYRDATNFGGTFTFSDLAAYDVGQPLVFKIIEGNPDVSFSQNEAYGFFQDEIAVTKQFNLLVGFRYEWQAKLNDYNNIAPRVGFAWAPGDQKTVFRGGMGIFYDQLPNAAVQQSLLIDGVHTRELVIKNPSYPDPFQSANLRVNLPSIWRISADARAPYLIQASVSTERRLNNSTQLTVDYQTLRGVHLFRGRNINAPLVNGGPLPNPALDMINQVESSASLRSNALVVTLRGKGTLIKPVNGIVQYTISRTSDDTNDPFDKPSNNYDARPEWGRANRDQRHRLNLAGAMDLKRRWRVGTILSFATGAPYNVTTGFDDNGDGVVSDRPLGIIRNSGNGPGFFQLDLRVSKRFRVPYIFPKQLEPGQKPSSNMELIVDAFNVLNHNNLTNVIGNLSSPLFGKPNASLQPRAIQFSAKYSF